MVLGVWQGGLQPLGLSAVGPPPQARQRQGVIPGRVRGRPQARQPRGAAVFNERLGPEARPGNVPESAEAASPTLLRGQPWGPSTLPCTTSATGCVTVYPGTLNLDGEAGMPSIRAGESRDIEARYPVQLCNIPTRILADCGLPSTPTLQAVHTLIPSP